MGRLHFRIVSYRIETSQIVIKSSIVKCALDMGERFPGSPIIRVSEAPNALAVALFDVKPHSWPDARSEPFGLQVGRDQILSVVL